MPKVMNQQNILKYTILFLSAWRIDMFTCGVYVTTGLNTGNKKIYYILQWTTSKIYPLDALGIGSKNLFNWTWTYKLSSDIRWSYILIYDLHGNEVGPKLKMNWPTKMKPIRDKKTKAILDGKTKAAAWFVSRCITHGQRELYVQKLKPELAKLNLILDVYGKCGNLVCPMGDNKCNELVKTDYYFYLSFENSIAWDYVTEKLLTALLNYAVPVVYGGADYTR
nr:alpha-(1,3)-fucosyltransferase C-like [Plodia interpunctella]